MSTKSSTVARLSDATQRRREWIDQSTRIVVAAGGAAVIGAIIMIFAYLMWVSLPLLLPASIEASSTDHLPTDNDSQSLVYADFGLDKNMHLQFYQSGTIVALAHNNIDSEVSRNRAVKQVPNNSTTAPVEPSASNAHVLLGSIALDQRIHAVKRVYPDTNQYLIVNNAGRVTMLQARFDSTMGFELELPYPGQNVTLPLAAAPDTFDVTTNNNTVLIAAAHGRQVSLTRWRTDQAASPIEHTSFQANMDLFRVIIGPRQDWLYLIAQDGGIRILKLSTDTKVLTAVLAGSLILEQRTLSAVTPLLGRYSLLVADSAGLVQQWTLMPTANSADLQAIRQFQLEDDVVALAAEPLRKGFAALTRNGDIFLLHATGHRILAKVKAGEFSPEAILFSDRADALLGFASDGSVQFYDINNPHPEINAQTLWGQVWYEGYSEPVYAWQSSSADIDFEPKFSLTPLAFGTLKAAGYALLFAIPIAVLGAVYTAYFMHPQMRTWVKPGIEVMAALPTVVLGFIGGLWLAPIIEKNLSSLLGIFLILPLGLLLFSYLWHQLPERWQRLSNQWYGLIACPLLIVLVLAAFEIGLWIEAAVFGGDSRAWLLEHWGLNYEQRNAMIVGIIMGLAVIPTVFSLCEDAIYGVPDQLTQGSLALGATRWQTLRSVVLLTASPGIFSALIIGAGRAIGETMIVLMVTGNTPIMGFNIFEGMRTFAANIAVELPEAEVASTHFRVLFLSALLLFVFTFLFNTLADIVRRQLRARYGTL